MKSMHDVAQYDLVPPNAKVPENVCYAQSFAVVKYVNDRRACHGATVNVPTFLEKFMFKTLTILHGDLWRCIPAFPPQVDIFGRVTNHKRQGLKSNN